MKATPLPFSRAFCRVFAGAVAALSASALQAQAPDDDEIFELSPFEVNVSADRGYFAANSISGSRINVLIQDLPLTIEVITSEFIEDTGSTDLRAALRYSAGIILQSQNDAFTVPSGGFGNVNNPEGATANKSDSSFKIRGFVTNNTLRNGFRRQHATDTINIARVEVVRGPSAILYGVGNFGGVVNYLTKRPLQRREETFTLGIGNDNWRRASLDVTGPINDYVGYRLTAAYEDREHFTELNERNHWFVSPVLEWRPFRQTTLTVDFEAGQANDKAIGFLSVRSPTLEGIPIFQTDRLETFGLLEFEGRDPRTFRWSGPDTYLRTDTWNLNIDLQQGFGEKVNFRLGFNKSSTTFEWRDVFGGISVNPSNVRALPFRDTIRARQIIDGAGTDVFVDVDNAVLQYNWAGSIDSTDWEQIRAEINFRDRFFEPGSFFHSEHNLLVGYSHERQTNENQGFRTADSPDGDNFMYRSPTEPSYIRFATQADGSPSLPFRPYDVSGNRAENEGLYAVYSGRFLNDRLFLIGGIRRDVSSSKDGFYGVLGSRAGIERFPDSEVSKTTTQFGASYEIRRGINIFALQSEGVEPNFGGQRDGLGRAIESSVAKSREVGIKLNFLDGRIASTISIFRIERDGVPFSYWWAPAPIKGNFQRDQDIVYRLDQVNLDRQPTNRYLLAAAEEWAAAKASGAVYDKPSADGRSVFTYINASTPEGAAYLDRVAAALNEEFALPFSERTDLDPWAGFLYEGFDDPEVNTAAMDYATGDFFQAISDESKGWEAQFILTPTDQLQVVLNYSNVRRTVTNPGAFVEYPWDGDNWDRWAVWYWPNANWGLGGVPPDEAYPGGDMPGLPNRDTSSWAGVGWGKGEALDDTPKHVVSVWASYTFDQDLLEGFQVGLGGVWESKREYASAFTTSGQRKENTTGESIRAFTDPRLTVNSMVRYSWSLRDRAEAYVQLNVDNVLNDRSQYGLIFAPGRSWRFNMGVTF